MCLICRNYRIIILIIIIISLGKILSSYIANTSRTHACTDVRTLTLTHTPTRDCGGVPGYPLFDAGERMGDRRLIEIYNSVFTIVWVFSRIKKILCRSETRTRDRMYCQTIRSVRAIYRDDRARIATCTLRTLTDRQT